MIVLAALLALSQPAQGQKPKVSSADAAKKAGLEISKTLDADVDADGKKDLVALANAIGEKGANVWLAVFGEDENGYVLKDKVKLLGKEAKRFEAMALVPPADAMDIIVEVYDDNPDEKVKRVQVFSGVPRLREIFKSTIFRPKDKDQREEWERDDNLVQYGDARPGWYFQDLENDGISEILVRRKPKVLEVPHEGAPQKLLIGTYQAVFAFDGAPDTGVYAERGGERFADFLPAYEIVDVDASSVWVDPTVLKDLKAQALSAATTAATTGKGKMEADIDLKPFMQRGADKNLETAWIEDSKTAGKGEYLEVKLGGEKEIHMVRITPGCTFDARDFNSHNVPTSFEVQLGNGSRAKVDLKKMKSPERPAIAVMDVPVKDRGFAKQYLIFFEGKDTASSVKIYLDDVKKGGSKNQTCISEVAVH